ncbi:hypothetical protein [Sphingomonas sp. ABOLE]|nr:hypothetical protein [Sphingomonas sp. ABOLE]
MGDITHEVPALEAVCDQRCHSRIIFDDEKTHESLEPSREMMIAGHDPF